MGRFLLDAGLTIVFVGAIAALLIGLGIVRGVDRDYPKDD